MKKNIIIVFAILVNISLNVNSQNTISNYKIANKFHIEGNEKWDYLKVDEATDRLFISHGSIVQVVDSKTGLLISTIKDTKGVHGIALASDLNKGFISNGKDSSVTVFNLKTLDFITKIKVTGNNPDGILFDLFTNRIFTFNGKSDNSTVIDAKTNKVIATIALNGKPEAGVSDGKGKIYLNIEDKSMIVVINSVSMKVEQEWTLEPGNEPTGIAFDAENNILFSVCANKLMVMIDANSGKVISNVIIGDKADAVDFDPILKCAYSSNGEGTVTVVKEIGKTEFKVLETITTQKGAKTITLNKKTHHIYLPTANFTGSDEENEKPKVVPNTFVIFDICPN